MRGWWCAPAATPELVSAVCHLRRPAGIAAATAWVLLVVSWLLTVAGHGPPESLARIVLVAALGAMALWSLCWLLGLREDPRGRPRRLALLGLLSLAMLVRLVGSGYGLAERFNRDEGIYTRYSSAINSGRPFIQSFTYPHLVFYMHAFTQWVGSLTPELTQGVARALWGVEGWKLTSRLILRWLTALLGALTVWPVFRVAHGLAGCRAATLAGLLML